IGGLAHDGDAFHLLVESDDDRQAGSEVFLASYATRQDLLDATISSSAFTQLNIGTGFGIGGLAASSVAEPAAALRGFVMLLGSGLLLRRGW
ncbi:MAG: hypothetical protein QNK05_18285, partial [Myxococcota bacterium]|nr:hypothetical protein [Myxococcota bacterium]